MSFVLSKGGKFNLAKEAPSLTAAGVGLGWNPNEEQGGPNFDLDVSAFLLGEDGKIPAEEYFVFYNSTLKTRLDGEPKDRPYSGDGSVIGAMDAIDGEESDGGDDEDMRIYFDKTWAGVQQILITASITKYPNDKYKDRRTLGLHFGLVDDCYIRVWNEETGEELFRYDLAKGYANCDAIEFGRFYRVENSWEFVAAENKGYSGGLQKLIDLYT